MINNSAGSNRKASNNNKNVEETPQPQRFSSSRRAWELDIAYRFVDTWMLHGQKISDDADEKNRNNRSRRFGGRRRPAEEEEPLTEREKKVFNRSKYNGYGKGMVAGGLFFAVTFGGVRLVTTAVKTFARRQRVRGGGRSKRGGKLLPPPPKKRYADLDKQQRPSRRTRNNSRTTTKTTTTTTRMIPRDERYSMKTQAAPATITGTATTTATTTIGRASGKTTSGRSNGKKSSSKKKKKSSSSSMWWSEFWKEYWDTSGTGTQAHAILAAGFAVGLSQITASTIFRDRLQFLRNLEALPLQSGSSVLCKSACPDLVEQMQRLLSKQQQKQQQIAKQGEGGGGDEETMTLLSRSSSNDGAADDGLATEEAGDRDDRVDDKGGHEEEIIRGNNNRRRRVVIQNDLPRPPRASSFRSPDDFPILQAAVDARELAENPETEELACIVRMVQNCQERIAYLRSDAAAAEAAAAAGDDDSSSAGGVQELQVGGDKEDDYLLRVVPESGVPPPTASTRDWIEQLVADAAHQEAEESTAKKKRGWLW